MPAKIGWHIIASGHSHV
jgi:hypothetical protein